MTRKSKEQIIEYIDALKKDHWERLRRNKEYRKDYKNYMSSDLTLKERSKLYFKCREQYLINVEKNVTDPEKEYNQNIAKNILKYDVAYLKLPGLTNLMPLPITEKMLKKAVGLDENDKPILGQAKEKNKILHDSKYLCFYVDVSVPVSIDTILQQVRESVHLVHEITLNSEKLEEKRKKLLNNLDAYEAWDMKQQGIKHSAIATQLSITDSAIPKLIKRANNLINKL